MKEKLKVDAEWRRKEHKIREPELKEQAKRKENEEKEERINEDS